MAVLETTAAPTGVAAGLTDAVHRALAGEQSWSEAIRRAVGVFAALAVLTSFLPPAVHPAIEHDFPDPSVLAVAGGYFAYSTQSSYLGGTWHVPVQRTSDLNGGWTAYGDALPRLPPWLALDRRGQTAVWAPEVTIRWDGAYLLYFTAPAGPAARCIGAAVASSPAGPFVPRPTPLVCRPEEHDSIDPATFTDTDGARYLLYSNGRAATTIWLQRLAPDGLATAGPPRALVRADRPEEHAVVEAPSLTYRDGRYVLFFSANTFDSGRYFINYATSTALDAPFAKHPGALVTAADLGPGLTNPGGQAALPHHDPGHLVFHAFTAGHRRSTFITQLTWTPEGDPSCSSRTAPEPGNAAGQSGSGPDSEARAARPASRRATGTRNGEQDT